MTPADTALAARLAVAIEVARAAGAVTLRYFRRDDLPVEWKADATPVTIADREAEQLVRQRVVAAFPQDAFCGEEFGEHAGTSGYRWIVDPIDGTKSFVHGVPLYGTLVGVERDGRSVIGVIVMPALGECVYAASGQGAFYVAGNHPPCPARVAQGDTLAQGLFLTSELSPFVARGALDAFLRLERAAKVTRTWGDCYGYLLVATGRATLMVDAGMAVWDAAAVAPVIEEAGGVFCDWQGNATIHSGDGLAASPQVIAEALAITRDYPQP